MKRGIIVSFEGIDGCGKTTIVKKFYQYLLKKNYQVIVLHEPGGTKIGDRIRKILLSKNIEMSKFCELFLYLASRSQLIEEKIKKNLERGKIIILDRYIDSTFAYQGYGRNISLKFIRDLHSFIIEKKYLPNITFLIDEKPENLIEILKRKNKDRIEEESLEFQKKVRKGYLEIAKKNRRVKIIKRQSEEETFLEVIKKWEEFLNEYKRSKKLPFESKTKK
ncbi:MAG: dTMP kinase [bacterium]|nr:dTMP kinase [bacterium]MDW8163523.1 dTMP kinase [Candidatus Omnitrophota bacterium]